MIQRRTYPGYLEVRDNNSPNIKAIWVNLDDGEEVFNRNPPTELKDISYDNLNQEGRNLLRYASLFVVYQGDRMLRLKDRWNYPTNELELI